MIAGVTEQAWRDGAGEATPLLSADQSGSLYGSVRNRCFLDAVIEPHAGVLQGKRSKPVPTESAEGVQKPDAAARAPAGKLVEYQLPVEDAHARAELGVEEIGFSQIDA